MEPQWTHTQGGFEFKFRNGSNFVTCLVMEELRPDVFRDLLAEFSNAAETPHAYSRAASDLPISITSSDEDEGDTGQHF